VSLEQDTAAVSPTTTRALLALLKSIRGNKAPGTSRFGGPVRQKAARYRDTPRSANDPVTHTKEPFHSLCQRMRHGCAPTVSHREQRITRLCPVVSATDEQSSQNRSTVGPITGCDPWASVAERPVALPPGRQRSGVHDPNYVPNLKSRYPSAAVSEVRHANVALPSRARRTRL
jgi:hypothetical protein